MPFFSRNKAAAYHLLTDNAQEVMEASLVNNMEASPTRSAAGYVRPMEQRQHVTSGASTSSHPGGGGGGGGGSRGVDGINVEGTEQFLEELDTSRQLDDRIGISIFDRQNSMNAYYDSAESLENVKCVASSIIFIAVVFAIFFIAFWFNPSI